jgi:predicted dehydrogenase
MPPLGIGMLGYGSIGKLHALAYRTIFEGRDPSPGLADGVANHLVIDALYSSARPGRWEKVAVL